MPCAAAVITARLPASRPANALLLTRMVIIIASGPQCLTQLHVIVGSTREGRAGCPIADWSSNVPEETCNSPWISST